MKDVARTANVSVGTVSNYLNGKKVRSQAAVKIEKAIKKLNYVRNNTARLLKTNRSPFVIFVIPTVWTPFFSELTFWMQKYLDKAGYKMILCISENDYEKEKGYVKMAQEQRVAGIITVSYSDLTNHIVSHIPLVSIEKESTGLFSLISSDNYAGGVLAAKSFQKRKIKKYYFIGSNNQKSVSMVARRSGYLDFCHNHGLPTRVFTVSSRKKYKQLTQDLDKIIQSIIHDDDFGKVGIFTYTDEVGLYLWKKLLRQQIRVPQEVQIIGFDGWKITRHFPFAISSIRQNVKEIALKTVNQLDKEIKHPNEINSVRINLPVSFKAGETTIN